MIRAFLSMAAMQNPAWRFVMLVVFTLVVSALFGVLLTWVELTCKWVASWRRERQASIKIRHVPGAEERLR